MEIFIKESYKDYVILKYPKFYALEQINKSIGRTLKIGTYEDCQKELLKVKKLYL